MIHAQIYDIILSCNDNTASQQVLILVTGDGNSNSNKINFPTVVERILKRGWRVELWSWELSLSKRFFDIQKIFPTRMTINYLDPHRKAITFEEKETKPKTVFEK